MKILFWGLMFCSVMVTAGERREHAAHVHGNMTLSIAFEGAIGEVDMDGAADNIIGFEHPAKTPADKKIQLQALETLRVKIDQFLHFDPSLKCRFESPDAKVVPEGNHSDVEAHFKIKCEKSPLGTKLQVDFSKSFPRLKKIEAQILVDQLQKSATMSSFPATVEFK